MNLSTAPIRATGLPLPYAHMVRARACGCSAGWIEVRNFRRPFRITNVEYTKAGVEHATGEGRRVVSIVDATIVTTVGEYRQPYDVRKDQGAVYRVMRFKHDPRNLL